MTYRPRYPGRSSPDSIPSRHQMKLQEHGPFCPRPLPAPQVSRATLVARLVRNGPTIYTALQARTPNRANPPTHIPKCPLYRTSMRVTQTSAQRTPCVPDVENRECAKDGSSVTDVMYISTSPVWASEWRRLKHSRGGTAYHAAILRRQPGAPEPTGVEG